LEIREKAAQCLGSLELCEEEADDQDTKDMWDSILKQIITTMILHTENPEINLRKYLIGIKNNLLIGFSLLLIFALFAYRITEENCQAEWWSL
jgi:hypothetical protein